MIPFDLRAQDVQDPLIQARNMTADVEWNVEHMDTSHQVVASLKRTLKNFDVEFKKLFVDTNEFLKYIIGADTKPYRFKRGAFNILGSISNVLFDTATQEQVDEIHNKIQSIDRLTEKERVMLNVHSSILNMTIREMRSMESALSKLQEATDLSSRIIREFSIQTLTIEGEQRMLEALMNLELALIALSNDNINLKMGLLALLQTRVTPFIISDDVLLSILKEASIRPPGLLFPPVPEYVALYRDVIRVTSRPTIQFDSHSFYFTIPMRGNPVDTFDVFQIDSLPYALPGANYYVQNRPVAKYIAISEDRNTYFLMNNFEHCSKHDNLFLCPPVGPVYESSTDTCESATFLGKSLAVTLCEYYIVKSFPPIFIKGPGHWTFSTSSPITLTLNCPTNPVSKTKQIVNGTGVLTLGQGCSAHSPSLTLPAHDTIAKHPPLTITRPTLAVDMVIRPTELKWLQNVSHLPSFDSSRLPVPLSDMMASLQPILPEAQPQPTSMPTWTLVLFGILLAMMVVAACASNYYVMFHARRTLQREAWQLVTIRQRKAPALPRPRRRGFSKGRVMLEPSNNTLDTHEEESNENQEEETNM